MIIDDLSRYETEEWSDAYVPEVIDEEYDESLVAEWDKPFDGDSEFYLGDEDYGRYDDGPESYAEPSGDW